jgi:FlaA1/EpsC-like NDP-sugar epimerase
MERFTAVETARVVSHLPNFFRKAMTQLMQEELHKELSTLEQVDIDQVLPNPDPLKLNNVLVTGVTGALGIYIVRELLTHSKAEIYCLVRAGTPQEAKERI